jgi:two-component system sensor histidine kinase UhpB
MDRDLVALQTQVRRLLTRLRPHALDAFGLEGALADLVESWRQRAPAIEWSLSCDESAAELPEEVATELYRMVQEGLTNIARHSKAGFARVSVGTAQGTLRILLEDDGQGIDPAAPRGYGLLGIAERARRLGGELEIDSDASGTRLRVGLALAPQAAVGATDRES